jgi:predicted nucleic acid-binding Zn ribbon protein
MDRDRHPSSHQIASEQHRQATGPEPATPNRPPSSSDPDRNRNPLKRNSSVLQETLPLPTPFAIESLKNLPLVAPQFTVPPLPSTLSRRRSTSPDTRVSPNPARQLFAYPVSYPTDAPREFRMSDEDLQRPSQKRKLSSRDDQTAQPHQAPPSNPDEESDNRRNSAAGKGAMSYDPVHEYHQQSQQHIHSRRPSSALSQRSQISSYSSNQEGDESTSPVAGDQPISRDGKKRKHKCSECGQYFTRLHNLKSHLLTHSQEKPFICDDCGRKFRRLHDLKRILFRGSTDSRTSQTTHRRTTIYVSRL